MSEPLIDLLQRCGTTSRRCATTSPTSSGNGRPTARAGRAGQRRPHDRHRDDAARRRRAARRRSATHPTSATTSGSSTSSGSCSTATAAGAETLADFRRVTARRLDALRALPAEKWDEEGFTPEGPGPYRQFMEIRVFDCWYHDQDIREALDRPGLPRRPGRRPRRSGASRRRRCRTSSARRPRAPQGSTVVFDGRPVDPPIVAAVGVEGRAALLARLPADPTARLTHGPAHVHAARRRALDRRRRPRGRRRCEVEGDDELGNRVVDNLAFTI